MGILSFASRAKGRSEQHSMEPSSLPPPGGRDEHHNRSLEKKAIPADVEGFSENAQTGVQKVEAVAMVWPKSHLIASYAL